MPELVIPVPPILRDSSVSEDETRARIPSLPTLMQPKRSSRRNFLRDLTLLIDPHFMFLHSLRDRWTSPEEPP